MNQTPETVARQLNRGRETQFVTAAIVAHVMQAQPGRFGYAVCDFPSRAQQAQIHELCQMRRDGLTFLAAVERAILTVENEARDEAFARGVEYGRRHGLGWDGFTNWGRAFAAGAEVGRVQFVG